MTGDLDHLSAFQWETLARLSAEIAWAGTSLRYRWPDHPASPYLRPRLALSSAIEMAREEDDVVDLGTLYARLFDAKPKDHRATPDYGFGARVEGHYKALISAAEEAVPFMARPRLSPALRAQGAARLPAPVRALDRAREMRAKAYPEEIAAMETQRVLAAAHMFPDQALPIGFTIPRLRADGDWLVGALRRFSAALEQAIDLIEACDAFLNHAREILGPGLRKDAAALRALPLLAGKPTLKQDELAQALGVSSKAAIGALTQLEEAGLAREIRGLQKWQVYVANDSVLGLATEETVMDTIPLPGGRVARIA